MRSKIALISFFTLIYCAASAQQKVAENMYLQKLKNGLEVLVIVDNTVPLATIEIACRNGSFTEPPEYNGLSHLYEHLFFSSNKDYPTRSDFVQKSNELEINSNATTREEVVNYFFTLPAQNLKEGLKFMNSAIRYPLFNPEDMKNENEVVNAEFTRHESDPMFAFIEADKKHLWGDNYSRKNVVGNHDIILSATPSKMDSIKNKYYWPNNSVLVIAGDVNAKEVFAAAEGIFGSWKAATFDPFKRWPIPEVKPLKKSDYYVLKTDQDIDPQFLFSWHGPDTRNDVLGTYVADVFSYLVNQNGSKLKKALVASGLAQDVGVNYYTQKYTGPISLSVTPNQGKIKECYEEVMKQIELWDDENYLSDAQIERAKRLLSIEQVQRREVTSDYAHLISFWWASASIDYYIKYEENLNKVTRKDLIDYVKKYIKGKPHVAGLFINDNLAASVKPEEFFNT
ncbi:MAG: insulinase family protein, partial [Pedobacter sp.]